MNNDEELNNEKKRYTSIIAKLSPNSGVPQELDHLTIIMTDIYTIMIQFTMSIDTDSINSFLDTLTPDDRSKKNNDGKTLEEVYKALLSEKAQLEKSIVDQIGDSDYKNSDKGDIALIQKYYEELSNKVKDVSGVTVNGDMSKVENLIKISDIMEELKKYGNILVKDTEVNKNTNETFSDLKKKLITNIVLIIVFLIIIAFEFGMSRQ